MDAPPPPPIARKDPRRIVQHGSERVDDYGWMRDDNWRQVLHDPTALRPDIREHLQAENAYTEAMMASTEALQAELFEEMKARIKPDEVSCPAPDGPFDYFIRYEPGAQHPLHVRRPRGQREAEEQVLLDVEALARGKAFFELASAEHSPDHSLYAYAADTQGSEVHQVFVKDLATGALGDHPIGNCTGDFAWSADSESIYWVWRDENGRPAKVYRRLARGGPLDDVLVYEEPDEGFFLGVRRTLSGAYIVIHGGNNDTSEVRLIACADRSARPRLVEPRTPGLLYELEHWGDRFVVRTNADGAVDFKLMVAEEADPSRAAWRELAPHKPGRMIADIAVFKDHLVRLERENAQDRVVVTAKDGLEEHAIAFDEEAFAVSPSPGYEFDTGLLRFVYQSPTTPRQWFDYDMRSGTRILLKTQEVPSGHDPERYQVRRLTARAPDGAEVPVTVLMRRGAAADGSAPLLLYGYGAYGHALQPAFSTVRLSLVDRGWIWAMAHVRGGSEKGRGWYLDGRQASKPNSFTDFIACAEHLVAQGYGQAGRIVAHGGSAGGLLMGAVANLRPELWGGIIAAVPFVDVLNTISDESLPLTPPEWPEWGDPIRDRAAFEVIAGYSPYDNVAARPYPAMLVTGGLSDPRVTYWEPAKWAARLREATTSGLPILLRINMEAGHGGASGRFEHLKEPALEYAFAIRALEGAWTA